MTASKNLTIESPVSKGQRSELARAYITLCLKKGMNVLRPLSRRSLPLRNPIQPTQPSARASTEAYSRRSKNPSFKDKFNPALTSFSTPTTTTRLCATVTTPTTTHTSPRSFRTLRANPITPSSLRAFTMATAPTAGIDQLVKLTSDLSLEQIRDKFPNCYPETNPVDVYRLHLTTLLEKITGVDPKIIYPAIQWTQGLDKGDVVVAVPALRVKGKKPDELAKEWAEKVCHSRTISLR